MDRSNLESKMESWQKETELSLYNVSVYSVPTYFIVLANLWGREEDYSAFFANEKTKAQRI